MESLTARPLPPDVASASTSSNDSSPASGPALELGSPSAPAARELPPDQLALEAAARQRTEALLKSLWTRKLPRVRELVRTLERAIDILDTATLTTKQRTDAVSAAHKLAGSLGMFGYHDGTRIARELEQRLDADQSLSPPVLAELLRQLITSLPL